MSEIQIILAVSTLIIISVIASRASDRFGVPALLLFIIIGMIAGGEGMQLIKMNNLELARTIGILALVIILFYGGIDTSWKSTRPVLWQGISLATVGVLITAVILAALSVLLLKFSWLEGLLIGAIVSSTDAAAVFSVLRSRNVNLKGSIKPLLEIESGINDPMAIFLTISLITIHKNGTLNAVGLLGTFLMEMSIGVVLGYLVGRLIVITVNRVKLQHEGLYTVLVLAFVLFTYSLASMAHGSGFLAVYIAGLVAGNSKFIHRNSVTKFHGGLAWLMQITMFLTLGLLSSPSKILAVMWSGLLMSLLLIFVARPLSVFLCLPKSGFNVRDKLMISWVGLRGAVPIIFAIFPLIAGVPDAERMFNIIFFIVLTSALFQGTTIKAVSKMLKVYEPMRSRNKYPIEFENMPGMEAELHEVFIPFESVVADKALFDVGIPKEALVTLVSRDDKFIIPNGSTVIEGGDVLLILADKQGRKEIEGKVNILKDKETIEREERQQEEQEKQEAADQEIANQEKADLEKGGGQ
jgi:cell volume regulation protein A